MKIHLYPLILIMFLIACESGTNNEGVLQGVWYNARSSYPYDYYNYVVFSEDSIVSYSANGNAKNGIGSDFSRSTRPNNLEHIGDRTFESKEYNEFYDTTLAYNYKISDSLMFSAYGSARNFDTYHRAYVNPDTISIFRTTHYRPKEEVFPIDGFWDCMQYYDDGGFTEWSLIFNENKGSIYVFGREGSGEMINEIFYGTCSFDRIDDKRGYMHFMVNGGEVKLWEYEYIGFNRLTLKRDDVVLECLPSPKR
jgi:hypothetical protein